MDIRQKKKANKEEIKTPRTLSCHITSPPAAIDSLRLVLLESAKAKRSAGIAWRDMDPLNSTPILYLAVFAASHHHFPSIIPHA